MSDTRPEVRRAALHEYLAGALDASVSDSEVLHDGLNLVIQVEVDGRGGPYVLRKPNKLRDSELFVDVEREYRLLEALVGTDVPAPEPVVFCEDETLLGERFYVMTELDGEAVPLGTGLPDRFRTPAARRQVAEGLVDALADLHSLDPGRFEPVCERQPPGDQLDATIERLDAATAVTGHEVPSLRAAADWLEANVPPDPDTALCHGDFRPGNVLLAGTARPAVSGVLDWETATLGGPLTELGYLLARWRDDGDPTPSLAAIESRHPDSDVLEELRRANAEGLAPFTAEPGSPSRQEMIARYQRAAGIDVEHARFYLALAALGLATVWEDLARHRVEAGEPTVREPYVGYMGRLAEMIVEGEFPI